MAAVSLPRTAPTKLAALFSALLDLEFSPYCTLYTSVHADAEQAARAFAALYPDRLYVDETPAARAGRTVAIRRRGSDVALVNVVVDDEQPVSARITARWSDLLNAEPWLVEAVAVLPKNVLRHCMTHVATLTLSEAKVWIRTVVAARGGAR